MFRTVLALLLAIVDTVTKFVNVSQSSVLGRLLELLLILSALPGRKEKKVSVFMLPRLSSTPNSKPNLSALYEQLGLSVAAIAVVEAVRKAAPARRVGNGRSNVSTRYPRGFVREQAVF